MSSVRYQNSIIPYNYRRYNRNLRFESYSVNMSLIQQAKNWFSNFFGTDENWKEDIQIDSKQIYVADINVNGYDPNYQGDENIYIGFTKLEHNDIKKITNGNHLSDNTTWNISKKGGYDEKYFKTWKDEHLAYWTEDNKCSNYSEESNYEEYEKKVKHKDADGNDHESYETWTRYEHKITCEGHYIVQAYVRCATLKGENGNLYQIDDENGNNKGLIASLAQKVFKQLYDGWSDDNPDAKEAKEEVAEIITENWETTYGFKWTDVFSGEHFYDNAWTLYMRQLSQGNGSQKDSEGNLTALGHARQYIENELDKIHKSKKGDFDDTWIRRIEIIDAATSYAGKLRYYYGADDVTNGISDCSAFISEAMGIERTTTASIMGWTHKDWNDLQPGDLICKDGHVRMYVCTLGSGGKIRYLTVENTSGSHQTNNVSGCSCALYSRTELEADGYVPIDISPFLDSNYDNVD